MLYWISLVARFLIWFQSTVFTVGWWTVSQVLLSFHVSFKINLHHVAALSSPSQIHPSNLKYTSLHFFTWSSIFLTSTSQCCCYRSDAVQSISQPPLIIVHILISVNNVISNLFLVRWHYGSNLGAIQCRDMQQHTDNRRPLPFEIALCLIGRELDCSTH